MNDTERKDTCVGMHTPLSERTRPGGRQITGTGPQCFNLRTPQQALCALRPRETPFGDPSHPYSHLSPPKLTTPRNSRVLCLLGV